MLKTLTGSVVLASAVGLRSTQLQPDDDQNESGLKPTAAAEDLSDVPEDIQQSENAGKEIQDGTENDFEFVDPVPAESENDKPCEQPMFRVGQGVIYKHKDKEGAATEHEAKVLAAYASDNKHYDYSIAVGDQHKETTAAHLKPSFQGHLVKVLDADSKHNGEYGYVTKIDGDACEIDFCTDDDSKKKVSVKMDKLQLVEEQPFTNFSIGDAVTLINLENSSMSKWNNLVATIVARDNNLWKVVPHTVSRADKVLKVGGHCIQLGPVPSNLQNMSMQELKYVTMTHREKVSFFKRNYPRAMDVSSAVKEMIRSGCFEEAEKLAKPMQAKYDKLRKLQKERVAKEKEAKERLEAEEKENARRAKAATKIQSSARGRTVRRENQERADRAKRNTMYGKFGAVVGALVLAASAYSFW